MAMQKEILNRLESNYSAIYVTIVSVMLALVLEDLVSIMRDIVHPGLFHWLTAAFVVHTIFNAWVGYSATASVLRLVPSIWDSLNVFVLSLAHFALNSSIGQRPVVFFYTVACYSAIGGAVTFYNAWRAAQDRDTGLESRRFRPIIYINAAGAAGYALAGALTQSGIVETGGQIVLTAAGLPFASLWLVTFLRAWNASIHDR
jgi:hypothetical protein